MMSGRKVFFHGNLEKLLYSQNVSSHYATINQIQTPMSRRLDDEVNIRDFILKIIKIPFKYSTYL